MSRRLHHAGTAVAAAAVLLAGTAPAYAGGIDIRRPVPPRAAAANPATLPTRARIAALFDRWNAALATGDPHRVADLYAPDAVLLPTLSARVRSTRSGIVDYFTHFLENKPVGRIQQRYIDILGPTSAVDTGLYQFTLTDEHGAKSTVDARYTFVYELRGGQWLIVNHHSSALPTGD